MEPGREEATLPGAPVAGPVPLSRHDATEQLLTRLQRHLDAVLDVRVRQALAPGMARMIDSLIDEVRREMTQELRRLVDEAARGDAGSRPR